MAQAKKSPGSGAPESESPEGQAGQRDTGEHERQHGEHGGAAGAGMMAAARPGAEQLEEAASEVGPQLGTVAVVAVATALLEAELLPAVLIGAGAALIPKLLPGAGYLVRPVLKSAIRLGYSVFTTAQQWAAEAGEQVQDIVAEVQAEQRTHSPTRHQPGTTGHTGT